MAKELDVHGVIAAIVTPFDSRDAIDEAGLRAITRYLVENGVTGIMTNGGTGEFPSLTRDERRRVTSAVAEETGNRVPIFAGTAACSTRETIVLSEDACEAGADAVIVTAPFYYPLPVQALLDHYYDLAKAISVPVVVYNNPLYTGNNLSPEVLAELAGVDGIVGVKQSNTDLGQLVELIRMVGDDFSVCTGIDSQFYPSLCAGARGIFSTAACVIPKQMEEIYARFCAGDHEGARQMHQKIQVLNRYLEYDPGYVAPCKEALRLLGLADSPVRRPVPPLTLAEREGIAEALTLLGIVGEPVA